MLDLGLPRDKTAAGSIVSTALKLHTYEFEKHEKNAFKWQQFNWKSLQRAIMWSVMGTDKMTI